MTETRPAAPRSRFGRFAKRIMIAMAVVVVISVVAAYFVLNHLFFNNPPAPPKFGLTPQGSLLFFAGKLIKDHNPDA